MTSDSSQEQRLVAELRAELATWREDAPNGLETFVHGLRALLGTEKTVAYGLAPRGDAASVEFCFGDSFPARAFLPAFDAWVSNRRRWALYDPLRPERAQRNTLVLVEADKVARAPIETELFSHWDLHARHQLRLLVCEGPSLLAWVGALQPEPFRPRQRRAFRLLLPALRRRLVLERAWKRSPMLEAALVAALEAIPSAAFLVATGPAVLHANSAGCAMLDAGRREVLDHLSHALRGRPGRFSLTKVRAHGVSECHLAVLRPERGDEAAVRVAQAAARWQLTPKQAQVLAVVVDGYSNRAIAALLGIAEGTAELHVSAILQKAGVETRSALVARVWQPG